MGSLVGTICYQSADLALDAYYAARGPSYTSGETSYLSYFEKAGSDWMIVRKSIASDGELTTLSSVVAPVVTFPDCNPSEQFLDGMTLGWSIAAAMVAAYAIKFLWNAK